MNERIFLVKDHLLRGSVNVLLIWIEIHLQIKVQLQQDLNQTIQSKTKLECGEVKLNVEK